MSVTRALAWNTGVQLAGKVVSTALGILIVGLMTRYLGQEGFGAYSYANAFLQIFALLLDLGLNVTLVAMLGEHRDDEAFKRRCVSALFTLRILMAGVVLCIIAPAVAWLMPHEPALKIAILALIGSFFFPAVNQVVTGVQQQQLKMHIAASGEVLGRLVLLGGLLYARHAGWGLIPVVWFVSLAAFANFVFSFLATRRDSDFRWNWDPAFWRIALIRSWPIGVSIAFNIIYYKADTLILTYYRPLAEVGVYGAAYRVLEILITVPFMYAGVLLPILAHHWKKNEREPFAKLLARSVDVMLLLVAPLIVGTYVLGTKIMTAVAGSDFAASGDVLRILILAVGIIYVNTVFSHAIVALDLQKKMLPIYVTVALVTLAGYVALIPRYGMWAAAWLTVISELCIAFGSLFFTRQASPVPFKPRTTLVAIIAAFFMGLVTWSLRNFWLPIPLVAAAIVYTGLIIALGGVSKATLKEMLSLKKEKAPVA